MQKMLDYYDLAKVEVETLDLNGKSHCVQIHN